MSYEPPMNRRAWLVLLALMVAVFVVGAGIVTLVTNSDGDDEAGSNGTTTTEGPTTTAAPTSTVPTTTSLVTEDDFRRILVELMNRRAEIYTTNPDPARVDEYATSFAVDLYQPDKNNLGHLQSSNQRLAGPEATLLGVRFEGYEEAEGRIGLTAVIEHGAVDVLDTAGTVVERVPARGRLFITVNVQRVEGEWRIVDFGELPIGEEGFDLVIAEGVPEL